MVCGLGPSRVRSANPNSNDGSGVFPIPFLASPKYLTVIVIEKIIPLSHNMLLSAPHILCLISCDQTRSNIFQFQRSARIHTLVPGRSITVTMRYQTIRWTDFYKQHKDPPTRKHDTEVASVSSICSTASTAISSKAVDSRSMPSQWLLPTKRRSFSSMGQT
jgi:hypothetical protein